MKDRKELIRAFLKQQSDWIYSLTDLQLVTEIYDYFDCEFWDDYYEWNEKTNEYVLIKDMNYNEVRESYLNEMDSYSHSYSDDELIERLN